MKQNDILKLYSKLPHKDFPALRDFIMKMATVFSSTYICHMRTNIFINETNKIGS